MSADAMLPDGTLLELKIPSKSADYSLQQNLYTALRNPQPKDPISYADILDAFEKLMNHAPRSNRFYFYTSGCGLPDEVCIDYWKGTGIIVVDRTGQQWLNGEKLEEEPR